MWYKERHVNSWLDVSSSSSCFYILVPVLVLLTKLDTLVSNAYNELKNKGYPKEKAMELRCEHAQQMLERLQVQIESELGKAQFPPKNYVQLTSKCGLLKIAAMVLMFADMHKNNADSGCYGRPTLFFLSSSLGLDPSQYSLLAVQHTFSCCPWWLSQPVLISAFLYSAEPVAANSLSFSCLMYTVLPPRGYMDYSI